MFLSTAVTQGQESNSVISKCTPQNSFYIIVMQSLSNVQSIKSVPTQNIKQNTHASTSNTNFQS